MRIQSVVMLISLGLLVGCGGTVIKEDRPANLSLDRLVAYDFVNVLVQVDEYHPDDTSLQMIKPDDRFGRALQRVLREANYDVQTVESPSDESVLDYSVADHNDQTFTYSMNVGPVFMEREYTSMDDGNVQPKSELLVEGVDVSKLDLNSGQPNKLHIPVKAELAALDAPVELESVPLASDMSPSGEFNEQDAFERVAANPDSASVGGPSFVVLVNGDENPPSYKEGENLVFTLQAKRDVRVSCYFQDPDAVVMRMYPTSFVSSANLVAGDTVHIPSTDEWSVHATRAGTKDEVLCVSVEPEHELAMAEFDSSPDFEVMAYKSLDDLLATLSDAIGHNPETRRVSINVY